MITISNDSNTKMDLKSLLDLSNQQNIGENEFPEERIKAQLDNLRKLIAFYREYPDLFVDDIKGPDSEFKFYSYQRIILRVMMRHRYTYVVLPRGSSKSFLTMMILMLRCILYPGAEMFVTTGGDFLCLLLK